MWEDQLNLADPATLVKMADDCGLPGKQLVERSGSDEISATYEQNRQDALAADVFGSPVYVLDGEVFWGQDRIELLADALKSGRAPYRSQVVRSRPGISAGYGYFIGFEAEQPHEPSDIALEILHRRSRPSR